MKTERRRCRGTGGPALETAAVGNHERMAGCGGNRIDGVVIAFARTAASSFPVGVASSCSPAAQQLSASACVTDVGVPPSSFDECIGQAMPSAQQAIRASGENCQPAQSATGLADNATTSAAAISRARASTFL